VDARETISYQKERKNKKGGEKKMRFEPSGGSLQIAKGGTLGRGGKKAG